MNSLDSLYREVILDHHKNPRNKGTLENPTVSEIGYNPMCGDEITISLIIEGDVISDITFDGVGCSISQSSASMMTKALKGKTIEESKVVFDKFKSLMSVHEEKISDDTSDADPNKAVDGFADLGDLVALQGVVKFPVRIKCATLGWNTFDLAVKAALES